MAKNSLTTRTAIHKCNENRQGHWFSGSVYSNWTHMTGDGRTPCLPCHTITPAAVPSQPVFTYDWAEFHTLDTAPVRDVLDPNPGVSLAILKGFESDIGSMWSSRFVTTAARNWGSMRFELQLGKYALRTPVKIPVSLKYFMIFLYHSRWTPEHFVAKTAPAVLPTPHL
jgi:hypothetical protein